jgi:chorismate mutase
MNSFDLKQIATRLESLEETIIFRLIDRAQLKRNLSVYENGKFPLSQTNKSSLLDHKHRFAEETDSVLGRYTIAEERPFFLGLPSAQPDMISSRDGGLKIEPFDIINLTSQIRSSYLNLLETLAENGEDGDFGTTAELDISALQAISRRVHFGSFFVAESKYLSDPKKYQDLIDKKDRDGLMALLTRQEVEDRIIDRIKMKCDQIQSVSNGAIRNSVDSKLVANFYFETIIPLTKEGEITYLLNRDSSIKTAVEEVVLTKDPTENSKTPLGDAMKQLETALKSGDTKMALDLLDGELKGVPSADELRATLV